MKLIYKISIPIIALICLSSWILLEGDNGHFVFLRGKKQYVLVEGTGEPTVVFITGKGEAQTEFKKVYSKIKKITQIFSYDRTGIGQSQSLNNDRTVDTMAVELNDLLEKENIKPPYILVGHSLGGYVMRCFTNMYPTKVSGLVFVEPAHEYEYQYGLSLRNDSNKIIFKELYKSYLKIKGRTKGHNAESKKCFDFDSLGFSTNQRIVKNIEVPTTIPITILLSDFPELDNQFIKKEIEYKIKYFKNWKTINKETKIIVTSKSGYFIQNNEPNLVIAEIKEMIDKVKK